MIKDILRAAAKERRRALTAADMDAAAAAAAARVLALPAYRSAKTVMAYMSAFKELNIDAVLKDACANKRLVVPVSSTDTCTITPVLLRDIDAVVRGAYGIREPEERIPVPADEIDLALIPGIAFDKTGSRAGFGKGYYDRFLADFKGIKIGLCYEFQVYDSIPAEPHDIKMDMIITEEQLYDF